MRSQVQAQDANGARAGRGEAQHHQDGGRLPGSVGPQQTQDLAAGRGKAHRFYGPDAAEVLGETLNFDDRLAHLRSDPTGEEVKSPPTFCNRGPAL